MKIAKRHLLTKLVPFTPKVSKIIDDGIERLFGDSADRSLQGGTRRHIQRNRKIGGKELMRIISRPYPLKDFLNSVRGSL